MPKRILLYMSRDDEEEFLGFLKSNGNIIILPAASKSATGFAPVDTLPEASQEEATRKFWLQNTAISLPVITELDDASGIYLINGFQSPVVEFLRSFTVSNIMLPGRLEADMTYFDDDTRDLAPKPAEFKKWFDAMEVWIHSNYRHLTLLTYVGPGAEKFRREGGILH